MRRLRGPWQRPAPAPAEELDVATLVRRRLAGDRRDDATLALVVEGGGMRGVLSASMAAVLEQDQGAVEAWLVALAELAEHPITEPTVQRARARAAIEAGEATAAIELLTASIARCVADDRGVEAAEGQILLARARHAG